LIFAECEVVSREQKKSLSLIILATNVTMPISWRMQGSSIGRGESKRIVNCHGAMHKKNVRP